jgi:hypothetical protein
MRLSEIIAEALKPSDYRKYVKGWDKNRFLELFSDTKFKTDKKKYRVYLPLVKSSEKVVNVPPEINAALTAKGYEVQDYKQGLAKQKDGTRVMKIGKLLPPELQQKFANDKQRQSQDDYMVVISRHPYDIAGMSTGRGWTSCMNLHDGVNAKYVMLDVEEGSLVAYLVKTSDPDIKKPVARIAIKPFIELFTKTVLFGAEDQVYGTDTAGFKQTVKNWVDYTNKKIVTDDMVLAVLSPKVYDDTGPADKILTKDANIKALIKNPSKIRNIENPSEREQLAAVYTDPDSIQYIETPTEAVQLLAVKKNGLTIEDINNPSEAVQLAAAKNTGYALKYIKNPSEAVQLAAVSEEGDSIKFIENPSEAVQLAAVKNAGETIAYFKDKNPSEAVKLEAVKQSGYAILYVDKPTEEMKLIAVKQDGQAIQYIENPTEEMQLIAVSRDGYAIEHIDYPSEEVQLAAVKNNAWSIENIENPSEAVQLAAIKNDWSAIQFIKKPTPNALALAKSMKK